MRKSVDFVEVSKNTGEVIKLVCYARCLMGRNRCLNECI